MPGEPEPQQKVGEASKSKSIGPKDFDSYTEDDWERWDQMVSKVGQKAKQQQRQDTAAQPQTKHQPQPEKKSNMTEARIQRRAVLRQILES
jgi:hypothetical protein